MNVEQLLRIRMEQDLERFIEYLGLNVTEDWSYFGAMDYYTDRYSNVYEEMVQDGSAYELIWYMISSSAKLELKSEPVENGVCYYFMADK